MTSFKPLWTAKAADHGEDAPQRDAQSPAAVDFAPLWQGGSKRDFVLSQLRASGTSAGNAGTGGGPEVHVRSQAPARESAPESAAGTEYSPAAAQSAETVPQTEQPVALTEFAPVPPALPAVPMITCEEHARLLEIERAAGIEAGRLEGRAEAAKVIDAERETMRSYLASIEAGFANSAEFFAPLKKLALHIAQQLVRGELQSSGAAVSRLIDRCLEGAGGRKPLAIRLHPHDIAMFRKIRGDDCAGLPLVEDASFVPGSVRVEFDDGWVDDMMQDRVDEIALALQAGAAIDPQPAPENS